MIFRVSFMKYLNGEVLPCFMLERRAVALVLCNICIYTMNLQWIVILCFIDLTLKVVLNPLSTSPTKWSTTSTQFVSNSFLTEGVFCDNLPLTYSQKIPEQSFLLFWYRFVVKQILSVIIINVTINCNCMWSVCKAPDTVRRNLSGRFNKTNEIIVKTIVVLDIFDTVQKMSFQLRISFVVNKSTFTKEIRDRTLHSLHKKWIFLLRISSVNVTHSCRFVHIYWSNP